MLSPILSFVLVQKVGEEKYTARGLPVNRASTQRAALLGAMIPNPVGLILAIKTVEKDADSEVVAQPAKVVVPYVFGLNLQEATTAINSRQLKVVAGSPPEVTSDPNLEGKVTKTNPAANHEADPNSNVEVFVAQAAKVAVPYVFGLDVETAKSEIGKRRLEVAPGPGTPEVSEKIVRAGTVTRTEPEAFSEQAIGQAVSIFTAKGIVPFVLGLTFELAELEITKRGLKVERLDDPNGKGPAGIVTKTDPAAGGEVVDLKVSVKVSGKFPV